MAYTIPFVEPESITVGDRIQWKRTLADFMAPDWTLTYYLRANLPFGIIDIVATADGSNHEVDVAPTTSTDWVAGTYHYQAIATQSGDSKLIRSSTMVICPAFADISAEHDGRTQARRILDSITALIENRAGRDEQRYALSAVGRSLDRITIPDLHRFRDYWLVIVQKEEALEKMESGRNTGKNILIRFNSP